MENIRPKHEQYILGSRSYMVCNKHPRHMQSPGVCSVCLGERLSQLATGSSDSTGKKATPVPSCSSPFTSSSTEGSPVHHKYRVFSMKHGAMSGLLRGGREDVFRKSKSLAAVERVRDERKVKNKKNKGFWSKLLRPRRLH